MIVEFLEEADHELVEAALWYDAKEPGLGKRLRDEVARVISRIAEDPLLWRERLGGYRRVNCPVFPTTSRISFAATKFSWPQSRRDTANLITGNRA
jgi:hypothetical protein